jgi:hypothetical protein
LFFSWGLLYLIMVYDFGLRVYVFYFAFHWNVIFSFILFVFHIWSLFFWFFFISVLISFVKCKIYFNFTLKLNNTIFPLIFFCLTFGLYFFRFIFLFWDVLSNWYFFFQFYPPTLDWLGIEIRGFFLFC